MIRAVNPLVPQAEAPSQPEYEAKPVTELQFIFSRGWHHSVVLDEPFTLDHKKDDGYYLISSESGREIRVFGWDFSWFGAADGQ